MGIISGALDVLLHQREAWWPQLMRHLELSVVAIIISVSIGIAAGAWLTRIERIAFAVVSIANLGRTIPSLAVLALAYPFVGTGFAPSIIAMVALGIPPVLLATYTGVREVDDGVRDAAAGMGLSSVQRLVQAELPVASPVILSGIRTSAVQIVASATLAALIGGGGLGEMILAGLTNLRFDLLLAGAILVAVLAGATELGCAWLERRGLPEGIRKLRSTPAAEALGYEAGHAMDSKRWRIVMLAAVIGAAAFIGVGTTANSMVAHIGMPSVVGGGGPLPTVTIGSKDFTEQLVLGELYAQALEAQGYPVQRRLNLGATAVADAALKRGDIDIYPEYTGTALLAVLKDKVPTVAGGASGGGGSVDAGEHARAISAAVLNSVRGGYKSRGMAVLAETPFSNGNAIVVTKATADKHHLTSMSDLARVSNSMTFGAVPGFDTREDGLPLLKRRYNMKFGSVKTFENGLKYKALADGKIDAVYGFETDGQIARNKLVILTDNEQIWPPYHAAPIVSSKFVTSAGPAFAPTINSVSALLDTKTMQQLNDQVDHGKKDPSDVAHAFLAKHQLDKRGPRPKVQIGSKDFTEQFVLGELYAQALEARGFPVERHLNLGATAVADAALKSGQIDMYPEYSGTEYTAVLKKKLKPGMSAAQVYDGVQKGYKKRGMDTLAPTPFSNGNALVVTKETADKYDLETLSDLARVGGKLRLGAIPGFDTREDGTPLLEKQYGMKFNSIKSYENGIKYKALLGGSVDVVYGFETDGQIAQNHLVTLHDDKQVWPAYQAVPTVSQKFMAQAGPDFAATINNVSALLDADTMRRLNNEVDHGKRDPADVARDFLTSRHLA